VGEAPTRLNRGLQQFLRDWRAWDGVETCNHGAK